MGLLRKINYYLLFALLSNVGILIFLAGCSQADEENQEIEKWTSTDPLAVSYRARHNKFLQGNLIQNPSFETGRIKKNLAGNSQVKIDGWEILGKDVKWINVANTAGSKNNVIHSGQHAICVQRNQADETEVLGQGVMSDYIKVIPGNYNFNLFLNLKDIKNPKSRLGTKIYDAVDIRIIFYDRNKLQIEGNQYSSYYNNRIDCSFKGVSFSNFNQIDSTGWLHINGHSHIFPFPDGDIPDETKFVKIFIGLKGTGTLWVDDINFCYTNQNFTTLERVSKYFDSTYAKAKLIIPQPKKVQILESKLYYRKEHLNSFPVILLPPTADKLTLNSAKILEKKITNLLTTVANIDKKGIPPLIKFSKEDIPKNSTLIFSIGENNIYNNYKHELPLQKILGKEQAYFIYSIGTIPDIVFVKANSSEGNYYAFQTLIQLFDNKSLLFHNANIIDYPSEETRALLIPDKGSYYKDILGYNYLRFNRFYVPEMPDQSTSSDSLFIPIQKVLYFNIEPDFNQASLDQILKRIDENSTINNYAFLFSDVFSKDINLNEVLKRYYNRECFSTWNISMFTDFFNSLISNGLKIEILPPFTNYEDGNNSNCNEAYINNFTNNVKGAGYLWSGFELQSWQIDETELFRLNSNYGIKPGFIDLSLYPRSKDMQYFGNDTINPYKILTSCLFEPYSNEIVDEVFTKSFTSAIVYHYSNIFDRIRIKTASDFYWNRENYNPDFALFKALVSEFGLEASYEILQLNDLYFKARSELVLAANKKNFHKNVRKAYQTINELKKVEDKLKSNYTMSSVNELNSIFADLINELERMKKDLGYIPIVQ